MKLKLAACALVILGVLGWMVDPTDQARQLLIKRIERTVNLPKTEAGLREKMLTYVSITALTTPPINKAFEGLSEAELKFYHRLVKGFAQEDAKELYNKILARTVGVDPSADEQSFYALYVAFRDLSLECPYSKATCSTELFREQGKKNALLVIIRDGGLLDRLRDSKDRGEAEYLIRRIMIRWGLLDEIRALTDDLERSKIARAPRPPTV